MYNAVIKIHKKFIISPFFPIWTISMEDEVRRRVLSYSGKACVEQYVLIIFRIPYNAWCGILNSNDVSPHVEHSIKLEAHCEKSMNWNQE